MRTHRHVVVIALAAAAAGLCLLAGCTPVAPHAPAKPSGSSFAIRDSASTYSTSASDPGNLPVYYQFDWGDHTSSADLGPFPSDSVISDTHTFINIGTYEVKARAKNAKSQYSDYGDSLKVKVDVTDSTLKWFLRVRDPTNPDYYVFFKFSVTALSDGATLAACGEAADYDLLCRLDTSGVQKGLPFQPLHGDAIVTSPTATSDDQALAVADAALYKAAPDGSQTWAVSITPDDGMAALDAAGNIYINASDSLYSLRPDGSQRWVAYVGLGSWGNPVITADGSMVISAGDSIVYAFQLADGTPAWPPISIGSRMQCSPAIAEDGKTVIGTDDGRLLGILFNATGGIVWTYNAGSPFDASPVIDAAGTIYITSDDGMLHAVNSSNGAGLWRMPLNAGAPSTAAISASGILYLTDYDSLYAVNTATQTRRWSAAVPRGDEECAPLILADGTVVVTGDDGGDVTGVYAFRGSDGPAVTGWPMYQHDAARTGRAGP